MACIGGFMATSYSSLARQKGWTIGSLFISEMSYPVIGGFLCQWGSVIISFFVNPWWTAFIVFALGFIGYIALSSILKVQSQIVSLILIVASFILIPIYVFSNTSTSKIDHFKNSIHYSSEGTKILNEGGTSENIDPQIIEKIISFKRQALSEARQVDINSLNDRLDGFGDHYNNEFIIGLQYLIEGFEKNDQEKFLNGQILLDKWDTWYSDNIDKIKKGK